MVGDRLGQRREEFPACQRVKCGDGLVEQQGLGPLGQGQAQAYLLAGRPTAWRRVG